jgi:hypothetical protein
MIEAVVELLDVRLEGEGLVGGRIACPPRLVLKPGQYLLAHAPALSETLPTALFPSGSAGPDILLAPPLPQTWLPGASLKLRGPNGKGFHLPPAARRVALATLDVHPLHLLPLVEIAHAQGCEIVLVTPLVPSDLRPEIEVLSPAQLPEVPAWADYLALDLPVQCLPALAERLGLKSDRALACPAEILVTGPMPCGGLAECGVCAIKTRQGWKYACKDGPVFDFNLLELI